MTWKDTYKEIAYKIDSIFTNRDDGINLAKEAVLILINLQSDYENGEEASIYLLPKFTKFHQAISNQVYIDEEIKLLIYQINKFTETYNGDLTTFVNSISWTNGCVPHYWAEYSDSGRFDTSEWNLCS